MRRMHRIYRVECLPRPLQLASARLPSFQNLSETKRPPVPTQFTPRHFMYAIFAYIGVVWGVNVGIYGIHGASGTGKKALGGCQISAKTPTIPQ